MIGYFELGLLTFELYLCMLCLPMLTTCCLPRRSICQMLKWQEVERLGVNFYVQKINFYCGLI